jgi:ATP-dependent Clp protease protease subunit
LKTRDTLNELYAKHTGQPVEKIKNDTERDNFMSSAQAKEYGIIDEVLITAKKKADERNDKK